MKKTYINPTMTVVKVKTRSLLTVSDPNVRISTTGSVNAAEVGSRRGYSIWDEDEEE